MGGLLFVAFVVVPIAELAVIVAVAHQIGLAWTLLTLFGFSIVGSVLAKRQGLDVWRRVRESLARGEMPSSQVVDGFLVLLAGALLLTPGFLTDVAGVVLLIPPARAAVRRLSRRWFRRFVDRRLWGRTAERFVGGGGSERGGAGGPRRARVVRVVSRRAAPKAKGDVPPPDQI